MNIIDKETATADDLKVTAIATKMKEIMELLGLDLNDDSLEKTPERIARMYVNEIFSGLDPNTFPSLTFIENKFNDPDHSQIVFIKTKVVSFCEHHFVPMVGHCYVAYIPNRKCIGLSKIPRIVRFFARRPQVQERLTTQIANCLTENLETEDVAVSITAQHLCVIARGVQDEEGFTTTNILRGSFQNDPLRRQEFFEMLPNQ